ncbi:MAG: TonB-dependent receptor [Azonexus sp.]|nr:TonB-dependent receptor [Betaproteobacteria bacterium]MBP6035695.1 TonB-dependent receptor [Azonexus sp.]MBP6906925.1 TonB-dependent receptor [Azonexus sp.]
MMTGLPAAAQELATLDTLHLPLESLLKLEVSSVSKFPQTTLDAPALVRVVERDDMRAFGYRTVADALRGLPGIDVTQDHSYSFLGVRGFNRPDDYGSRVLLLVDGLRLNDGIYDQAQVGSEAILDTPILKRVEYFAGPTSSLYGGNGLFGVVNLVTRSGAEIDGWEPRVEIGTRRSRRSSLAFGRTLAGGQDVVFYASLADDGGGSLRFDEYGASASRLDGDRYAKFFAKFTAGGLRLSAGFNRRTKDNPAAPYGTRFGVASEGMDEQAFVEAAYESMPGETLSRLVRLYANHYRYRADWPFAGTPNYVNRDRAQAQVAGGEYRLTYRGLANHVVVGGVEVRRNWRLDQGNADLNPAFTYLDVRRAANTAGAYAQDEWRLSERWLFNAGLRFDKVSDFSGEWSPRLAAIYRPDGATAIKLLYGRAFRAPNQYERFYGDGNVTQKPSPGAKPERITTQELALEHFLGREFRLGASLFHYDLEGALEQRIDPADGLSRYVNGGNIHVVGGEIEAEYRNEAGLRLKSSLTHQEARDEDRRWLTNSPRNLAKVQAYFPALAGWDVGVEFLGTGRRRTQLGDVGGYGLVNLTVNRRLGAEAEVRLGVTDLGNRRHRDPTPGYYAPIDAMPQVGRQAFLQWLGHF